MPFTARDFFALFARYNEAVWPAQWLLLGIAVLIVAAVIQSARPRVVPGLLALLWLWMGVVYHLTFFRDINPAAIAFGVVFIGQAALLVLFARTRAAAASSASSRLGRISGNALVGYALLGYPLIGSLVGHYYPERPTFGAPCPTTIFTLGVLIWTYAALPWWVMAIPVAWTVIGTSAALQLSVPEDFGLPVAGLVSVIVLLFSNNPQRIFNPSRSDSAP